ncbi:hypothetical protein ACWCQZ_36945 [Streptomyces sp. NPDC002285]
MAYRYVISRHPVLVREQRALPEPRTAALAGHWVSTEGWSR